MLGGPSFQEGMVIEMKKCPRCGEMKLNPDNRFNALSRKDNKTYICSDCGFAEATETFIRFKAKFALGQLIWTRGVSAKVAEDEEFAEFAAESLKRHITGDWGDLCAEDKQQNELALKTGYRLFSAYEKEGLPKIWIITEADRSATTILFPEEY